MEFQARVLYDFEAVGEGELTVRAEDLVTVTSTTVGEGWWMGRAADGREGVLPEAYVERIQSTAPAVETRRTSAATSSWGDDWDSEEEHQYEDPKDLVGPHYNTYSVPASTSAPALSNVETSTTKPTVARPVISRPPPPTSESGYNFSLGKFTSVFGKSNQVGDYLSGLTEATATLAKEAVLVNELNKEYFLWEQPTDSYTCKIGYPKKGSKFGGMKSYIQYPVTPSFSNIQVSRRYKHFDWLHERLSGKFGAVIAIPPLPEKQVTGRFEEELIEKRKIELQSFVDRICRHPVLANSEVWKHFIKETDDKRWTAGKRKAESDVLVGISFLTTIQAPSILTETENAIDRNISQFAKDIVKMDSAVKSLSNLATDQVTKYKITNKKDYQDIGRSFSSLGQAVGEAGGCLVSIGQCYNEMSSYWEEQAAKDWEPLQYVMHDYKGLVGSWDNILGLYHNMADKHKEIARDGGEKEKDCSVGRFNTYRIGVQSERNFFQQELGVDINYASQNFIVEQINFHRKMTERLEQLYQKCWPTVSAESGPHHQDSVENFPPPPPADPLNAWD